MVETDKKSKKIRAIALLLLLIFLFIGINVRNAENISQIQEFKSGREVGEPDVSITLADGEETQYIEYGDKYIEKGATAWYGDENISGFIVIDTSKLDLSRIGTYAVIYKVEKNGIEKTTERTVSVIDTKRPEIVLKGNNNITIGLGSQYNEPGFIATDNYDGDISDRVKVTGMVDINQPGEYTQNYVVSDSSGNRAEAQRKVYVVEEEKTEVMIDNEIQEVEAGLPTITLKGTGTVYLEVYSNYIEDGYLAQDTKQGDITDKVIVNGEIDTNMIGTYTLIYTVTNDNGIKTETTRTIVVRDTTKPTIELIGDSEIIIREGISYNEQFVKVSDNYDKNITDKVTISGDVDVNTIGVYYITYVVTDSSGNYATVQRKVTVIDMSTPIIELIGDNVIYHDVGTEYIESGAIATDEYYGDITANLSVTGEVNWQVVGTYNIEYNVTNPSGKNAIPVIRRVIVEDKIPPIIEVESSIITLTRGEDIDLLEGVAATDNYDGDITANINYESRPEFNKNIIGEYVITYAVKDSSNNEANSKTKTVVVKEPEIIAPEIDLSEGINIPPVTVETNVSDIVDNVPIPVGFYYVGGTRATGVVISDNIEDKDKGDSHEVAQSLLGNQFVWVPVTESATIVVNIPNLSKMSEIKWASGNQNINYFANNGTVFDGRAFSVTNNGIYTIYAKSDSGLETIETITVTGITKFQRKKFKTEIMGDVTTKTGYWDDTESEEYLELESSVAEYGGFYLR